MRKFIFYISLLTLSASLLYPAVALAVTTPANSQRPVETQAQRVEKNKTKYSPKLNTEETTKLKSKCKASQVISKALNTQVTRKNTTRAEAYTNITKAITEAVTELKAAGKDIAVLEAQAKELAQKIEKYNTDLVLYQTAIADLSELDCVTDPAAFKAALEAARDARKTVAEDVVVIKTYINTNVKKTLKELDDKKDTTEEKPGTQTTTPTNTQTNTQPNTQNTGGNQ